jgi:hypothetical protein
MWQPTLPEHEDTMNEQNIKRFRLSSSLQEPICIVDAADADEALLRAALVARESRRMTAASMPTVLIEEMHEKEPATLPYYKDGFFQMIELRDNGSH